jgi:DNA (cytosine-5)-methyltransferase 1
MLHVPDELRGLRELSLFTGAGGGVLGSHLLGWNTVAYVEWDDYCQKILRARIADGNLADAPIFGDVREFDGTAWQGKVDVVSAGFPCQPFSVAGRQAGDQDERNMWPDTIRVVREVRPRYAFLENVPGLLSSGHGYFGTILGELAESGYDAVWDCIQAASVYAPHRRERLWILAYPNGTQ